MRCKTCQYSLIGLADNRCPECGTPFDPRDPSTFEERKRFWRVSPNVQRGYVIFLWLMAACGFVSYCQLVEHWWTTFVTLVLLAIVLCHFVWTFVASIVAWHKDE